MKLTTLFRNIFLLYSLNSVDITKNRLHLSSVMTPTGDVAMGSSWFLGPISDGLAFVDLTDLGIEENCNNDNGKKPGS